MNLAFMGGCLNNQAGLPRESSYYYILRELLAKGFPEFPAGISLGYYTSYNLLFQATTKLIEAKSPDIIFLFLRPFPLMALNKIWIKFENNNKEKARELHPALFNRRNMNWMPALTNYSLDDAIIEPRREKFGLRDLNLLSGLCVGLNTWAEQYLMNEIEAVNSFCKAQNKKLVLISLPQNPESLIGNYVCNLTNRKLKSHLHNIPFIEISFMGEEYFEPDGIHYNAKGHKQLAQLLYAYLSEKILPIPETVAPIAQIQ